MTTCRNCLYKVFKADWPSALGWILTLVIAWRYMGITMCEVIFRVCGIEDIVLLRSDASHIFALVSTLISMAGMKTYERVKGANGEQPTR